MKVPLCSHLRQFNCRSLKITQDSCPKCGIKLLQKNLIRHILKQHQHACSSCHESFPSQKKFLQHQIGKHSRFVLRKFKCKNCSEELRTFYCLRKHKREAYLDIQKTRVSQKKDVDLTEFQHHVNLFEENETVKYFLNDFLKNSNLQTKPYTIFVWTILVLHFSKRRW